jgi:hypothetical protein
MGYRLIYFSDNRMVNVVDIVELTDSGRFGWFRADGTLTSRGLEAVKELLESSTVTDTHVMIQSIKE